MMKLKLTDEEKQLILEHRKLKAEHKRIKGFVFDFFKCFSHCDYLNFNDYCERIDKYKPFIKNDDLKEKMKDIKQHELFAKMIDLKIKFITSLKH